MTCIVFVNPPLSLRERYGDMEEAGAEMPPIGLLYLASVCRQNHLRTFIVDAPVLKTDFYQTAELILEKQPEYVGITATTVSIFNAASLAKAVLEKAPSVKIILGGPHVSAVPRETMERFPQFDAGVIGEGEDTIIDLINACAGGEDLRQVKGMVTRQNGDIIITDHRPPIHDLDRLPFPAWDLLPPLESYKLSATRFIRSPVASLITSRGCYGKCVFCDVSIFGRKWRAHSGDYVIRMIDHLRKTYRINGLIFNDDTFTASKPRLKQICEGLIQDNIKIGWTCSSRVTFADPEMLELMKRAGCFQIAYGIESGAQEVLNLLKKGITLEQTRRAISYTHEAGIRTKGYFMIGNPGETKDTIRKTIAFAKDIDLDDFQVTYCTPLPGTELYSTAKNYGTFEDKWEKMNMWEVIFVPHGLTEEDLRRYARLAFRDFYLRPKILWGYFKNIRDLNFFSSLLRDAIAFLKFVLKR